MTEKPFIHKKAYANVKSNFISKKMLAKLILKVLKKKGLSILVGQVKQFIILQKNNKKIKKIYSKGEFPKRTDMNLVN